MNWWRKQQEQAQIVKFFGGPVKQAKKPTLPVVAAPPIQPEPEINKMAENLKKWMVWQMAPPEMPFAPKKKLKEPEERGAHTRAVYGYWSKKPNKPKPFKNSEDYTYVLLKKGFKIIGSGAFSNVLSKENGTRVIKVGRRPKDDAWLPYVKWAKEKGYEGTFAPKVYRIKEHEGFYVAIMERMKEDYRKVKHTEKEALVPHLFEFHAAYKNDHAGDILNQIVPGIKQFAEDLRGLGRTYDLHKGNIMRRENGTICFTDPVC